MATNSIGQEFLVGVVCLRRREGLWEENIERVREEGRRGGGSSDEVLWREECWEPAPQKEVAGALGRGEGGGEGRNEWAERERPQ